jgi:hypothetical protein
MIYKTAGREMWIGDIFEPITAVLIRISAGMMPENPTFIFFAFYAIVAMFFCYLGIRDIKDVRKRTLVWFLFLILFLPFAINIIRQAAAMAVLFYGVKYISQRRLGGYLVCCLVATMMHTSAIVGVVFYPVVMLAREVLKPPRLSRKVVGLILVGLGIAIVGCLAYIFVVRQFTVAAFESGQSIRGLLMNPIALARVLFGNNFIMPQYILATEVAVENLSQILFTVVVASIVLIALRVRSRLDEVDDYGIMGIIYVVASIPMTIFMATGWRVSLFMLLPTLAFIGTTFGVRRKGWIVLMSGLIFIILNGVLGFNGIVPYNLLLGVGV